MQGSSRYGSAEPRNAVAEAAEHPSRLCHGGRCKAVFSLAEPATNDSASSSEEKGDSLGKRTFWAGSFPKLQERTKLLMLPAC